MSRYSDFQVKTIDSFMTTVFKASAIDFGYNPDFEILMSNESLMGHAFDLFLRNVREGHGRRQADERGSRYYRGEHRRGCAVSVGSHGGDPAMR